MPEVSAMVMLKRRRDRAYVSRIRDYESSKASFGKEAGVLAVLAPEFHGCGASGQIRDLMCFELGRLCEHECWIL
jgi:hypothetical protein